MHAYRATLTTIDLALAQVNIHHTAPLVAGQVRSRSIVTMTTSTIFVEHIASDATFQLTNGLRRKADQLRLDPSSRSSFLAHIDNVHSQIREDIDTLAAFAGGHSNASRQQIESLIDNLTTLLFEPFA